MKQAITWKYCCVIISSIYTVVTNKPCILPNKFVSYDYVHLVTIMQYFPDRAISGAYWIIATKCKCLIISPQSVQIWLMVTTYLCSSILCYHFIYFSIFVITILIKSDYMQQWIYFRIPERTCLSKRRWIF